MLYARTRPGYDPYGWLVWGKLTIHLKLDTNGAPSWKPMPFLFTVPYAVFGRYALWLWMVTSVAISLSGLIFAWRIAFRLTYSRPERRYASYVAGLFAAGFLLAMQDPVGNYNYMHYILSAESDTMIVSLCLLAIDLHLSGHHKAAFWIWWLGALGRPEVWPFYGLARAVAVARRSRLPALAVRLGLRCWRSCGSGSPALSSKSFLTAGNIAENSPRAIHGNKITGTIDRFHELLPNTVWVAGGAGGGVGGLAPADRDPGARRRRAAVGADRDRVRPARLPGRAALHVRGRRGRRGAGRRVHRPDRPRAAGAARRTGRGGSTAAGSARGWPRCVGTWGTVLVVGGDRRLDARRRPPAGPRSSARTCATQRARTVLIGRLSGVVKTLGARRTCSPAGSRTSRSATRACSRGTPG